MYHRSPWVFTAPRRVRVYGRHCELSSLILKPSSGDLYRPLYDHLASYIQSSTSFRIYNYSSLSAVLCDSKTPVRRSILCIRANLTHSIAAWCRRRPVAMAPVVSECIPNVFHLTQWLSLSKHVQMWTASAGRHYGRPAACVR